MPTREFVVQNIRARIAVLTSIEDDVPNLLLCIFDTSYISSHSSQFLLKICYFSLWSLKVLLCFWCSSYKLSLSSRFAFGGRQKKLNFCLSYWMPSGKKHCPLNSVDLQSRSFLSLFQAASLKTNNFPLILRGRRSLHLFLLQLFPPCVTETESLHLNKSLDGWIGDVVLPDLVKHLLFVWGEMASQIGLFFSF